MAQPTNTFDSYDAVGIRESLEDIIYDVSPEDTPFYSACGKIKTSATLHEWQTDALRAATTNAHIEGDETTAEARTATVRRGNRTQIFKNAVTIPGTDDGLNKAGRAKEMAYQTLKVAREQKLDIEKALFDNNAAVAGNATTARELAGAPSWLITNVNFQNGNSGANPTGDGSDARTDDGTPTAFSQTKFDDVVQKVWEAGGKPQTVYLSPFQVTKAVAFTGNNNQRSQISADQGKVVNYMAVYLTHWGEVTLVPSRLVRSRDVFVMQDDMWAVGVLRPTKNEALAKTGDHEKRQVTTELTLICKNEKASGIIADNTTS